MHTGDHRGSTYATAGPSLPAGATGTAASLPESHLAPSA